MIGGWRLVDTIGGNKKRRRLTSRKCTATLMTAEEEASDRIRHGRGRRPERRRRVSLEGHIWDQRTVLFPLRHGRFLTRERKRETAFVLSETPQAERGGGGGGVSCNGENMKFTASLVGGSSDVTLHHILLQLPLSGGEVPERRRHLRLKTTN